MVKIIEKSIRVSFDEIHAKKYYTTTVKPHSDTASKIYLPKSLERKKVIVIVRED